MPKLILISGWATPQGSLIRASRELSKTFDTIPLSIDDLIENPVHLEKKNSLSVYASNLLKIIQESKDPCLIMGWSLGGIIALETACYSSEKILGLILVSTSPSFCSREDFPHGFPQANVRALSLALRKDPQGALINFYRKVCHPHPTTKEREENWLKEVLAGNFSNLHRGLDYLLNIDLRHAIRKLNIPSRVIHGRQDSIIPWQAGLWFSENISQCAFDVSEEDGHDIPLRKPAWLVQKLKFLDSKISLNSPF